MPLLYDDAIKDGIKEQHLTYWGDINDLEGHNFTQVLQFGASSLKYIEPMLN